jgi:hypothetical protein
MDNHKRIGPCKPSRKMERICVWTCLSKFNIYFLLMIEIIKF